MISSLNQLVLHCLNTLPIKLYSRGQSQITPQFSKYSTLGYGAKQISSGGFAFHSPSFRSVLSDVTGLMGYMECVARPDNWISTSYPAGDQPDTLGPSFFADNLVNPVYFEENVRKIPEKSIVVGTYHVVEYRYILTLF